MEFLKELIAPLIFLAAAGLFLWTAVGSVQSLVENKRSPAKTVKARVASKRAEVGDGEFSKTGVRRGKAVYFAVFETDSGECEFSLSKQEFDGIEENDEGYLTSRGSRFLGFERDGLLKKDDDL